MLAVVHDARLARPPEGATDGVPQRVHLEAAARRGIASAVALLDGPERPDALEYLYDMFMRLHSMREHSMNGPLRFTPTHIKNGAALFGWTLSARDIEALVVLDYAAMHPESVEELGDG